MSIDGNPRGTFDQYAAHVGFGVAQTFGGLESGAHTIVVRVIGRGASKATDTQVVVDKFRAGGDLVASPDVEASWALVDAAGASASSLSASDLGRSTADLTFRGTGVDWITERGPDQGRAEMYLDGLLVRTVDNYASEPTFGIARSVSGLADGVHTLRIVVLGKARRAATGTIVSIDRFSIIA